jgi:predicted DNA-binding mobile mystery protein A
MSQGALATRLGVSAPNVAGLEASELKETISIGKLAEVARAMDCTLLYVLVPNSTLEDTVRKQANQVASATLGYVATTMDLEDQRVDAERHQQVLAIEAARVIESNRQWRTEP